MENAATFALTAGEAVGIIEDARDRSGSGRFSACAREVAKAREAIRAVAERDPTSTVTLRYGGWTCRGRHESPEGPSRGPGEVWRWDVGGVLKSRRRTQAR